MTAPKPEAAPLTKSPLDSGNLEYIAHMAEQQPEAVDWPSETVARLCATIDADRQRIAALESRIMSLEKGTI